MSKPSAPPSFKTENPICAYQIPSRTHLADFCTEPNGSSECSPCKREEFMEYPNVFHSCYECQKCREDQVELSPCQATRNTECACKEGTFCDPDLPCEMCEKCQPRERPRRDLVPQTGKEPIPALRGTFYIFAGINSIYWKKFGRSLDVQENDLPLDRTQDSFYEMLNKWLEREGSKASVNTLLETLDQLDLSGVADDISSELVRRGLFKPAEAEEQGGSCVSIP
ncbi:tumor necrosis factor receptor superfamily member 10B [Pitangus sulphuratus]|nr:tumor necrosis factor receptor superfamily member 10B [Pitangus sulphuratus]